MGKLVFIFVIVFSIGVSAATAQMRGNPPPPPPSDTFIGKNCPFDLGCLNNPYGAGSSYKQNGFNNPYSPHGSRYSNTSPNNPYATKPPKLYDEDGNYLGLLSANPYLQDSTSNPYGKYGNPNSKDSINNPYGVGSRYSNKRIYIVPQEEN